MGLIFPLQFQMYLHSHRIFPYYQCLIMHQTLINVALQQPLVKNKASSEDNVLGKNHKPYFSNLNNGT